MANLTRLGFPDLDLEPFFSTIPPTENEIAALLEAL